MFSVLFFMVYSEAFQNVFLNDQLLLNKMIFLLLLIMLLNTFCLHT